MIANDGIIKRIFQLKRKCENKVNMKDLEKEKYDLFEKEAVPNHILAKMDEYRRKGYTVPQETLIKRPSQIEKIRKACKINTELLNGIEQLIHDGIKTQEIDDFVVEFTHAHGAICAPYQFEGYPKSVCISVNDVVCHGIPTRLKKLHDGDIVNVDVSTILDSYYADASRMFMVGKVSKERQRLVEESRKCMLAGIEAAQPWHTLGDIGAAVSAHAKKQGYSVVREIGGHGVGIEFHEDPWISYVGRKHEGMLLVPGMIITIEPMINAGKADVVLDPYDDWTVYTEDGKDSAQWETTILITDTGNEILTY